MKHFFYIFLLMLTQSVSAQVLDTLQCWPLDTTFAKQFDPVSGPGFPVEGNGYGGWRSGSKGVKYMDNHPRTP